MGVQKDTRRWARRGTVEFIAGHRVADAGQVNANLMCASGPDLYLEKGEGFQAL